MFSTALRFGVIVVVAWSLTSCCSALKQNSASEFITLKSKEFVDLPDLGLRSLPARIDTGAKISALHATHIEYFYKKNVVWVRFNTKNSWYEQPLLRKAKVKGTCGESSMRAVIRTNVTIGSFTRQIEITLVDRSQMSHPFLLGREAMHSNILVNPGASLEEDE